MGPTFSSMSEWVAARICANSHKHDDPASVRACLIQVLGELNQIGQAAKKESAT